MIASAPQPRTSPQPRARRRLASRTAALIAAVVAIQAAHAEDDSSAQFWLQDRARAQAEKSGQASPGVIYQRPTHLIPRSKPVRGFTRSEPGPTEVSPDNAALPPQAPGAPAPQEAPGAAAGSDGNAPATANPAPTTPGGANVTAAPSSTSPASGQSVAQTPSERIFRIAVLGDNFGQFLEQGLSDVFAGRPDVSIVPLAKESSGLVRNDYFDWVSAAHSIAEGKDKIDIAIVMLGSNDRQPMRDGADVDEALSPKWRQIYADRVKSVVAAFRDKKIPLLWIGSPILKSPSLSDAMLALNDIYRTNASGPNATYVDIWDQFADEDGRYELYGPDVNGDNARLRSMDGVNFTRTGARKLAQFVSLEIQRVIDASRPAIDSSIAGVAPQAVPASPVIANASPSPTPTQSNAVGSKDLRRLVPTPAAPIQPVIPTRPAAGPVVALTAPVVAPDGKLATRTLVQSSSEGESAERSLASGTPVLPRAGRADDFRWPHD